MNDLRIRLQGPGAQAAAKDLAEAIGELTGQAPRVGELRRPAVGEGTRAADWGMLSFFVAVGALAYEIGKDLPRLAKLAQGIQAKAREIAARDGLQAFYEINGRVVDLATVTQDELLNIYLGARDGR